MVTSSLLPDLLSLRELLAVPERWTKGAYARDKNGNPCPDLRRATAWCLDGAMWRVCPNFGTERSRELTFALAGQIKFDSVVEWNDAHSRTHSEVLALIDKAIEAARKAANA